MANNVPLYQSIPSAGPSVFYEESFRNMIETHLEWLISNPATDALTVTNSDAYRYQGDFDGLLKFLNVPKQYHWIALRMNGLTSSLDYDHSMVEIIVPSIEVISRLQRLYKTSEKIS